MNVASVQPFSVVLIEDDDGHANLIRRNLQRAGMPSPIVHLSTGAQALTYFINPGVGAAYSEGLSIIVLDLNLPDIDGFEILRRLKADDVARHIPVIVLTTTDHPQDIEQCYALGCNVFMTKPVSHSDFSEAIRKLSVTPTAADASHPLRNRER